MSKVTAFLVREPVRVRVYGALTALLPLLVAFGVDLTDAQSGGILAFSYAVLIGGTEWARAKVTPA